MFQDGRFLTRQRFVGGVRSTIREAGVDDSQYCGHDGGKARPGRLDDKDAGQMEESCVPGVYQNP